MTEQQQQQRADGVTLNIPTEDDGNVYAVTPIGRGDAVRLIVTDRYRPEVSERAEAEVILSTDEMLYLAQWLIGKVRELSQY